MTDLGLKHVEYGEVVSDKVIAMVAGFTETTGSLDPAAECLVRLGYNVIGYSYSNDVLLCGNAEAVPTIIDQINEDFVKRTTGYVEHRHAGFSLGAGIAWNLQKRHGDEALPGTYGSAGADLANLVLRNLAFRAVIGHFQGCDIKRAYTQKGHTLESLREVWHELNEPPLTGFSLILGGWDFTNRPGEVLPKVDQWRQQGIAVDVDVLPRAHHDKANKWFVANIDTMLARADALRS